MSAVWYVTYPLPVGWHSRTTLRIMILLLFPHPNSSDVYDAGDPIITVDIARAMTSLLRGHCYLLRGFPWWIKRVSPFLCMLIVVSLRCYVWLPVCSYQQGKIYLHSNQWRQILSVGIETWFFLILWRTILCVYIHSLLRCPYHSYYTVSRLWILLWFCHLFNH